MSPYSNNMIETIPLRIANASRMEHLVGLVGFIDSLGGFRLPTILSDGAGAAVVRLRTA